ncbi:MAG: GntR family transcriptional regulator [Burkholderiales bacterium]|nr:GntR family transcriptional regulator [Burkholderiales bacterium]
MRFSILPSATEPIYRQIIEQVRRQVASGQWPAGTELPSIRNVAQEHAINPMTVSKAYSLLERRRGMGMVIAAIRPAGDPDQRLALLEPTLRDAARQAAQLGLGRAEVIALLRRCLDEATED